MNQVLSVNGFPDDENGGQPYGIEPLSSVAIRNDSYKVVSNFTQAYDQPTNACVPTQTTEFYAINENVPSPQLDKSGDDLLAAGQPPLTEKQQSNYNSLVSQLNAILGSQPPCPGDGNIDGTVNRRDVVQSNRFQRQPWGKSSWYDFDLDGLTNSADLTIITENLGKCNQ